MRSRTLNKINEIQEIERSNNTDDDVVVHILRTTTTQGRGLTLSTLGVSSTTQSSATSSGRTTTRLSFLAEYDDDGMPHFTVGRIHDTRSPTTISTKDRSALFNRLEGIPAADWKGVELQRESNSWYNFVDIFSDIENIDDTDYLAMGYWLRERKERSSTNSNYTLYIGAGGNDAFVPENVVGLTGTATYEGPATGLHMKKENATAAPVIDYFNAKASLMAVFGDATALGTVSGTITEGMTAGGEPVPELTLGSADISSSGRNFSGDTSGNGLTGKWGGKFYSNGAGPTDHPGSAAGTFGAKTADDLQGFIGAFGAYKN